MTHRLALVLLGLAACTPSKGESVSREPAAPASAMSAPEQTRTWPKPAPAELAKKLTPLQLKVTQEAATEPPFRNAYWDNHAAGLYVDVVTGEPLFSSRDKFDSGTGWPSFSRPIDSHNVVSHSDSTLGMERTEVVSKSGRSHLGHVFDDGPGPTHMRYCINSASLRFVPAAKLVEEGYGEYAASFDVAPGAGGRAEPPATPNSCALPPPGEKPGCNSALDVATFSRAAGDERIATIDGVLDVVHGFEGTAPATQVTYDPTRIPYTQLFAAIRADHGETTALRHGSFRRGPR